MISTSIKLGKPKEKFHWSVKRFVSSARNRNGLIEIGPMHDAQGLGDTLMVTPAARALGSKAVVVIPESMKSLAFLFRGYGPLRYDDRFPVFPWHGRELISRRNLTVVGLRHFDSTPKINLRPELIPAARGKLSKYPNPIAFCPTCSPTHAHVRQRPWNYWPSIVEHLKRRYNVLQFGYENYPLIKGAVRMRFEGMENLAAMYHVIGNYVGVDTGDYHLMLAVGGRTVVASPHPVPIQTIWWWTYSLPGRVEYGALNHPSATLDAIERMGL